MLRQITDIMEPDEGFFSVWQNTIGRSGYYSKGGIGLFYFLSKLMGGFY
jgi:hypothetical protein